MKHAIACLLIYSDLLPKIYYQAIKNDLNKIESDLESANSKEKSTGSKDKESPLELLEKE